MSDTDRTPDRPGSPVFEMRTATEDTLVSFVSPLESSFGEVLTPAEIAEARRTWETDRLFAAFDGDRQVGTCANLTFRLTVPGGTIAAAGLTLVGVLPGERRRGVLTAMMRHHVADARDHGEAVAVLWASEGPIYQRFGYGLGTFAGTFELRGRAQFARPATPQGRIRLVGEDEALGLFAPIFEAVRPAVPGMLARSEAWWRWNVLADTEHGRQASGPKFRVVHEVAGHAEGYAIYRTKSEWDERGARGTVTAVEVIGATALAQRELWAWLTTLDLYPVLRGVRQPVPHPLQLLLAEPRAMGLTVSDGIWVRLLDLGPALAGRTYGRPGTLVLEVADPFLPENAGRWRLAVGEDGAAQAARTGAEPDLSLDVGDLGACYLGANRLSELAGVGRVDELAAGALARADAMFASARAPWCGTPF